MMVFSWDINISLFIQAAACCVFNKVLSLLICSISFNINLKLLSALSIISINASIMCVGFSCDFGWLILFFYFYYCVLWCGGLKFVQFFRYISHCMFGIWFCIQLKIALVFLLCCLWKEIFYQFRLEFAIKSFPKILFQFLTSYLNYEINSIIHK